MVDEDHTGDSASRLEDGEPDRSSAGPSAGDLATVLRGISTTSPPVGPAGEAPVAARTWFAWSLATPTWQRIVQVHLWSAAEWARLTTRPTDVQVCTDGTRVALRIV